MNAFVALTGSAFSSIRTSRTIQRKYERDFLMSVCHALVRDSLCYYKMFFMKNVYGAGYRQSRTMGAIRRRERLPHRKRSSAAWAVPRSASRNRVDPRGRSKLGQRGARRKWCTGSRPDAIGRSHQIWAPWRRTSRPECSRYIRNISLRNKIRIFLNFLLHRHLAVEMINNLPEDGSHYSPWRRRYLGRYHCGLPQNPGRMCGSGFRHSDNKPGRDPAVVTDMPLWPNINIISTNNIINLKRHYRTYKLVFTPSVSRRVPFRHFVLGPTAHKVLHLRNNNKLSIKASSEKDSSHSICIRPTRQSALFVWRERVLSNCQRRGGEEISSDDGRSTLTSFKWTNMEGKNKSKRKSIRFVSSH